MKNLIILAPLCLCPLILNAQPWPDKNTSTPYLVQTGFGPNGGLLPQDGASYCGPTSAAMALGYLNNAGFTQLIGASPTDADYLNLVRVLSGLGQSSDSGGTDSNKLLPGVATYFNAKGIGADHFVVTNYLDGNHPTISDIATENVDQNILIGILGWYQESAGVYTREGGHFVVITDQAVGSPGTLTIHNPFPNALLDQSNIPSNVQQTVNMANFAATTSNTSPSLDNATYLQFDTPTVGPTLSEQGILEQVFKIRIDSDQLPSGGFTPQDWVISTPTTINTGGGNLSVETKVTGAGGISKTDEGDLIFRRNVTLTGNMFIAAGSMVSEVTLGDSFGTGSIALSGTGRLKFHPNNLSPTAVTLEAAYGSGSSVSFQGANVIELDRGGNSSLAVTLGGNTDGTMPNLTQSGSAPTLVIKATDLGNTEKLLIAGTGGNLPALNNGSVGGNIVGASGATEDGQFLSYDVTNGFVAATTTGGDINSATATDLYQAASPQTLTANRTMYGLAVNNTTVSGSGQTLNVGPNSASDFAGVILNGGTISTQTLGFGASKAAIYANTNGGIINSALTGSHGFIKFGSGQLTLNAASAGLSGDSYINAGGVILNASLSGTDLHVRTGAHLQMNSGGSFAGTTIASASAQIILKNGTLNNVELQSFNGYSGPIQGGTLSGSGTVTGDITLNGYIAADPDTNNGTLTINGIVTPDAGSAFIWSLPALLDNNTGTAGIDWNNITFTNAAATFGNNFFSVGFFFDFGEGLDPNSNNSFWNENHEWTLFTYSALASAENLTVMDFPSSAFPSGNFFYGHDGNTTVLHFHAVPEPSTIGLCLLGMVFLLTGLRPRAENS